MPSPTEQLRAILVDKCPELLELSFGCEIQYWDETMTYSHKNNDFFVFALWDRTAWVDRKFEHAIEILWHPPQWSHVLRSLGEDYAIWGSGFVMRVEYWPTIQDTKYHFVSSFPNPTCEKLLRVDLSKSPLDQEPEILEQLILILTK